MKDNIKVSIAIASYNNSRYIKRCIDSVINQTHQNLEILIVDDGSNDDTSKILEFYSCEQKVKVFVKENGGLSRVRQLSLNLATGTYICFLDADDYVENNYVALMLKKIEEDKSDICICSSRFLYEDGSVAPNNNFLYNTSKKPIKLTTKLFADNRKCIDNYLTLTDSWNKMYRVDFLKAIDVVFDMPRGLNGSDMVFNYKVALFEPLYSTIENELYIHVFYFKSAVHRKKKDLFSSYEKIITDLINIASQRSSLNVLKPRIYDIYMANLRNAFVDTYLENKFNQRREAMTQLFNRHSKLSDKLGFNGKNSGRLSSVSIDIFSFCSKYYYLLYLYIIVYTNVKKAI